MWQCCTTTTRYIRLTQRQGGQPAWLNANRILTVESADSGSRVLLEGQPGGRTVHVSETPDQVMALLGDAK